ncbi:TonB-dependent receptor domain-containing protein [Rugamonas apoptosis]|uniref:TonB-dependent receptor n=1 Tax=Rugamonas apoptosis TaxID=2758570 RepID=A0A7W2INF9_9BURK|nr:TonB-dependent receptor [Rugamonas apoptosis]MBA5690708.1 TonB-dependent receptor [Rugamonas apoptosis]
MSVYRLCLPAVLALSTTIVHADSDTPTTVVVAGKLADVINKVDRKVYRATTDIQASTGSAADLLNNIPAVDVDIDGMVSLRGDTSVTILIDGNPSSQMQGAARGATLMGMAAADIEAIEIITSPSAEFKPDGTGGIINIITRKNRKRGGAGQMVANLGNDGRHNGSVSGGYNTGTVDLSGTLGNRQDWRRRVNDDQTGAPGAAASSSHQVQDESSERWYGKGALKYAPNDKRTLGVTLDYARRTEHRISAQEATPGDAPPYHRDGNGGGPRADTALAFKLDQKLATPGEALSFALQRSHSIESNLVGYQTVLADPSLERDFDQQVYDISRFAGSYSRPEGENAKLKMGYDVEYDHNSFNNWRSVGTSESHFRYRLAVNAAYAIYAYKRGALETLLGLRFEQADIQTLRRDSGDASNQRYRMLYPTLNLLYTLSDSDSVSLGYSKRVKKPDPEDVNPYINATDPKTLRQGNPNLAPQMTDALELAYRHDVGAISYGLIAYYRRSRNGDTDILVPQANDVVLITKVNLPTIQSGGLEFSAVGKLLERLGYNVSGNAFYNQINGQQVQGGRNHSDVGFNGKGTLDYQLGVRDRLQVGVNYRGKRLTPQGYLMPFSVVNLGYRHLVDQQWTLVATLSDAFNTQRLRRIYETPTFSGDYRRHQSGQVGYVGLAFSFGGARKVKDVEFNYE